jgi:hypothetical protein
MITKLLNKIKAWRIENMRLSYSHLSSKKQFQVQEYYDKHLQDHWLEFAQDNESFHDQDDMDYFLEQAWLFYLDH